jgi:hypothetical protein
LSKEVIAPSTPAEKEAPRLRRVLERWDIVLLFVVAVRTPFLWDWLHFSFLCMTDARRRA